MAWCSRAGTIKVNLQPRTQKVNCKWQVSNGWGGRHSKNQKVVAGAYTKKGKEKGV